MEAAQSIGQEMKFTGFSWPAWPMVKDLVGPRLRCGGAYLPFQLRSVAVSIAYVLSYVGLEWATKVHELGSLGITLWNPSPALTILFLAGLGLAWTPIVFLAALVANLTVYETPYGIAAAVLTSASVAFGYGALTAALLHRGALRFQSLEMRELVSVLVAVPIGALVVAGLFCGSLVVSDVLSADRFIGATAHYWVGDTVGTIVALPLLLIVADPVLRSRALPTRSLILDSGLFLVGLAAALWLIFGIPDTNEFQFFYLLFLPVIWTAVRQGFLGVAVAIFGTHVALVLVTLFTGHPQSDVMAFQFLMVALSASGLLLGMAITAQRNHEQTILAQQAELGRMARNTTAGAMGVALAHQISQPISTVAAYVHVAQSYLRGESINIAEAAKALRRASGELQRARGILEGLRDFVSRGRLQSSIIDVVAISRRIVRVLRHEAATRNVELSLEAPAVLLVKADPVQIEQVLLNIITNAIEAAARADDVVGRVCVRVSQLEGRAHIEVEDDGPGIAPEIAGRLFEPFVSSKLRGMGLGLALSKQIMDSHGGNLSWFPLEPRGTRFLLELTSHVAAD
jgi:two-component system, LuxR family, sensor kinase FixL